MGEQLELSSVLTVVTTDLYVAWRAHRIYPVRARLQKDEFWEVISFVLNGLVFLLIGLQLPAVLQAKAMAAYNWLDLLRYGLLLSAAVLMVRFAWVFGLGCVSYHVRRGLMGKSGAGLRPAPDTISGSVGLLHPIR